MRSALRSERFRLGCFSCKAQLLFSYIAKRRNSQIKPTQPKKKGKDKQLRIMAPMRAWHRHSSTSTAQPTLVSYPSSFSKLHRRSFIFSLPQPSFSYILFGKVRAAAAAAAAAAAFVSKPTIKAIARTSPQFLDCSNNPNIPDKLFVLHELHECE